MEKLPMRKPDLLPPILTALLLAPIFGCDSRDSPRASTSPGDLASRLEAAKAIHDVSERDKALAKVALSAADAGDAAVTDHALAAMHNVSDKDAATYSAALRLAKAGKADAAVATAKTIHDVSLMDKTLAKIAKGDVGD